MKSTRTHARPHARAYTHTHTHTHTRPGSLFRRNAHDILALLLQLLRCKARRVCHQLGCVRRFLARRCCGALGHVFAVVDGPVCACVCVFVCDMTASLSRSAISWHHPLLWPHDLHISKHGWLHAAELAGSCCACVSGWLCRVIESCVFYVQLNALCRACIRGERSSTSPRNQNRRLTRHPTADCPGVALAFSRASGRH